VPRSDVDFHNADSQNVDKITKMSKF
jgi:hypothetical protein